MSAASQLSDTTLDNALSPQWAVQAVRSQFLPNDMSINAVHTPRKLSNNNEKSLALTQVRLSYGARSSYFSKGKTR